MTFRTIAKRLMALTPYRLLRSAPNRFDAIEHFLHHVAKTGYRPHRIIDGGAHLGLFARCARAAFPAAEIHMIEPQPACAAALEKLARQPGFHFHPVALTSERRIVRMAVGGDGPNTGAHIAWVEHQPRASVDVQGDTLDALFAPQDGPQAWTFLKLDLQGHELPALRGAARLLERVDLLLTEVSFFTQFDEPTIAGIVGFLNDAGFDLYDVVSIAGRGRDDRARQGDFVFARRNTPIWTDRSWA